MANVYAFTNRRQAARAARADEARCGRIVDAGADRRRGSCSGRRSADRRSGAHGRRPRPGRSTQEYPVGRLWDAKKQSSSSAMDGDGSPRRKGATTATLAGAARRSRCACDRFRGAASPRLDPGASCRSLIPQVAEPDARAAQGYLQELAVAELVHQKEAARDLRHAGALCEWRGSTIARQCGKRPRVRATPRTGHEASLTTRGKDWARGNDWARRKDCASREGLRRCGAAIGSPGC